MKKKAFRKLMINDHLKKDEKNRIAKDLRRIQHDHFLRQLFNAAFLGVLVFLVIATVYIVLT